MTPRGVEDSGYDRAGRLRTPLDRAKLAAVEFEILYCEPCGYRDRAVELATVLRQRFARRRPRCGP